MECGHEQALADGVNVNYDVYRIRTEVTEAGAKVESGYWLEVRGKVTRARRNWQLDRALEYEPTELDRGTDVAQKITYRSTGAKPEDLIKAFRTSYYPRIAVTVGEPGFRENPEDVRAGERADPLWSAPGFLRSSLPIAKKVIATGTDINPVEIVVFMRSVKSRSFSRTHEGPGRARDKGRRPARREPGRARA